MFSLALHRYVRALGAFYMRLVGRPLEVYEYLEPLYNDYRKLAVRCPEGEATRLTIGIAH